MKQIDLLGVQPRLHINNKGRYTTFYGLISTIILGILMILCIISFGYDIIAKKKPSITISKKFEAYPKIESKSLLFAVFLHFPGAFPVMDVDKKFEILYEIYKTDSKKTPVTTLKKEKLVKCSESKLFQQNLNNITNYLINDPKYYYCTPDNQPPEIAGVFGTNKFKMYQIVIQNCNNKTMHGECVQLERAVSAKDPLFVHFIYPDTYVDSYDYENPIAPIYSNKISKINIFSERRDYFKLKKIDYWTDYGILLENSIVETTFQFESFFSEIFYNEHPFKYYLASYTLSPYKEIYSRKYLKIQEVAATTGGFLKFFLIIFRGFIKLLTSPMMYQSIFFKQLQKISNLEISENMNVRHINIQTSKIEQIPKVSVALSNSNLPVGVNVPPNNRIYSDISRRHQQHITNKPMNIMAYFCNRICLKKNKIHLKIVKNTHKFVQKKISIENILKIDKNLKIIKKTLYSKNLKDIANLFYDYQLGRKIIRYEEKPIMSNEEKREIAEKLINSPNLLRNEVELLQKFILS